MNQRGTNSGDVRSQSLGSSVIMQYRSAVICGSNRHLAAECAAADVQQNSSCDRARHRKSKDVAAAIERHASRGRGDDVFDG